MNKARKSQRIKIFIVVFFCVLVAFVLVFKTSFRYKFWHNFASAGWADVESKKFKALNDKYGIPGNPATSSTTNEIGIWVNPKIKHAGYEFLISLHKSITDGSHSMNVFVVSFEDGVPNEGDPKIYVEIPPSEIDVVIKNGIPQYCVELLSDTAKKNNWATIPMGVVYMPKDEIKISYQK